MKALVQQPKEEIISVTDLAEKQENATLAREAERVFGRIDSGEEKTISSKDFFKNAKQRGFDI